MDHPLLDQRFYQPAQDWGLDKNTRSNGKQMFYHYEKLLTYN